MAPGIGCHSPLLPSQYIQTGEGVALLRVKVISRAFVKVSGERAVPSVNDTLNETTLLYIFFADGA
jgi:hypothetical protein